MRPSSELRLALFRYKRSNSSVPKVIPGGDIGREARGIGHLLRLVNASLQITYLA